MGVPAAGMVLLPLNTRLAAPELVAIVQAARPKVLVTDRDPGPLADVVARVVTFEEWDVLLDHASPSSRTPEVSEDDLALLYFTGGTTGRPKGVMLTHRNLVANSFHKTLACRFEPDDVYLAVAPFFHVAGTAALVGLLWMGGSFVILPAFDPATSLDAIERHRVSVAIPVPTMVGALVAEQSARPRRRVVAQAPRSCRLADHHGPAATSARRVPDRRARAVLRRDRDLVDRHVPCRTRSGISRAAGSGSVGQQVVGVEMRIVDARRQPVPAGRRRRGHRPRAQRDGGLLGERRARPRPRSSTAGTARVTSASSTTSTTSPCSIEPRT